MTMHTSNTLRSTSRTPPLNCVKNYLNKPQNRLLHKDIPPLPPNLLEHAQNCVSHTPNNNDVLEFIGDRCVNLFAAMTVGDDKLDRTHHTTVTRLVSNNDTLGRLAFALRLHEKATVSRQDREFIEEWDPQSFKRPPKVLADIFEAYVGAVYVHHGWPRLQQWLEKLFSPIIKAANSDYWLSITPDQLFGTVKFRDNNPMPAGPWVLDEILDYISDKAKSLEEGAQVALKLLPKNTRFRFDRHTGHLQEPEADKVEIAAQLLKMWICQIVIMDRPDYIYATARGAHLFSTITGVLVSEQVLSYLACLLYLDDFFNLVESNADYEPSSGSEADSENYKFTISRSSHKWRRASLPECAIIFKAAIGYCYHKDPEVVMQWGKKWLTPIVLRLHDILVKSGCTPVMPREGSRSPVPDVVEDLASQMAKSLRIGSKENKRAVTALEKMFATDRPETSKLDIPGGRQMLKPKIVVQRSTSLGPQDKDAESQLAEALSTLSLDKSAIVTSKTVIEEQSKTDVLPPPEKNHQASCKWKPITNTAEALKTRANVQDNKCDTVSNTSVSVASAIPLPIASAPIRNADCKASKQSSEPKATSRNDPKAPLQPLSTNTFTSTANGASGHKVAVRPKLQGDDLAAKKALLPIDRPIRVVAKGTSRRLL